ncbi:MAG: hypothetical protein WC807_04205 [Hyphomicrobium sp.]|jgi:hypothetical protein
MARLSISRSRPEIGYVTVRCETRTEPGSVVQILTARLVTMRRDGAL